MVEDRESEVGTGAAYVSFGISLTEVEVVGDVGGSREVDGVGVGRLGSDS